MEIKNINVKTSKGYFEPTLGADPEMIVCNQKTVIKGNAILKEGDEFGVDGNGVSFEIRPDPSKEPMDVVNNMRSIMIKQCLKNPLFFDYDWYAGSWQREYPLGGHIHFGVKEDLINHKKASNILAQYVGAISILLEDTNQGKRRRTENKYGHFEDYRPQTYGFEYRCPSSWITQPYVALAFISLAKVVMCEVLNNDKFKAPNRIKANHVQNMETQAIFEFFPDIWNEITQMALYPKYKQYIDVLYYMVKKRQNWFPAVSMKEAWGIVDFRSAMNSKYTLADIWKGYIRKEQRESGFITKFGFMS